ncbi:WD repeat-containing protein WRAP73 [Hordeum vulgare subsp. vulgare]|uniref:Anaphase-promoting complex subunit 4 WD40 domain-containing protein n=1 Tax=Hordeum vulgare subsp. vulgare TaxID=112509 RepID=A0A8I6WU57_HORVV|nr:WD repeat-containing protein WRAP73 [Hordeum vulgare subsp. vulgare]
MEFTEAYKQTGPCCFSPDARLLAVAVDYRLVIRDVVTLKVVQLFSCVDKINFLEWAPDSEYILCGLYKRPMVQAWSLSQPDWTCKIDEGSAGIAYARWSPDSRHILTTSEFQLRLTVWSLVNTACVHVQWPKHAARGVSFTKDGKFAAICTRRDCKDYVNLLSCHSWEIMGVFAVDTLDLAGVEWSPDDSAIVAWDSLLEYKVLIYSPDGRCLFKYSAYESGLGVKTVGWSPCGQFLAVGSYDQAVRILNHLTWKTFAEFTHPASIRSPYNAAIFKEVDDPWQLDMSELCLSEGFSRNMRDNGTENGSEGGSRVKYAVMDVPITVPAQKPASDKPNPKQGIGMLSWSSDGHYFFTRNDNMPTVLWIWDICRLELAAVLVQKDPIRAAAWDPTCPRLVLCTESPHLYMWTPSGACCVNIPLPNFRIVDLKWNSAGSCLLLKDRDSFCCAAIVSALPEEEPDDQTDETSEDE